MKRTIHKTLPKAVLQSLRGTSEQERLLHRLHSVVLVLKGLSCVQAARLYGDSARSVAYWVKRFDAHGIHGLEEGQRSGRPSSLTPVQLEQVRVLITKGSSSGERLPAKEIASFINRKFQVHLTVRQCRRIVKTLNDEVVNVV